MMMFDDKVGGWGWLNADVIKKYTRKKTLFACAEKKGWNFHFHCCFALQKRCLLKNGSFMDSLA